MQRVVQDVIDGPVVVGAGERLEDTHIIQVGSEIGRVLFQRDPAVVVTGRRGVVADCVIELQSGGMGIRISRRGRRQIARLAQGERQEGGQ